LSQEHEDRLEADGIGPETEGGDMDPDMLSPCCPHCGRPLSYSDDGVLAWT